MVRDYPEAVDVDELFARHAHLDEDLVDVKGQDYAKRTLLIVAAGCHNVLTLWSISPLASSRDVEFVRIADLRIEPLNVISFVLCAR